MPFAVAGHAYAGAFENTGHMNQWWMTTDASEPSSAQSLCHAELRRMKQETNAITACLAG